MSTFLLAVALVLTVSGQEPAKTDGGEGAAFAEAGRAPDAARKVALWAAFVEQYPKSNRLDTARRELLAAEFQVEPQAAWARVERYEKESGRFAAATFWRLLATHYLGAGKDFGRAADAARRALKSYTFEGYEAEAKASAQASKRPPLPEDRMRYSFNTTRVTMLETLGEAYAKEKKDNASAKVMREALELSRSASKAALTLAAVLDRKGHSEEALPYAAQGLLARPSREAREQFEALYRKVRPGGDEGEAYLDETYRRLFPAPVHPEAYRAGAARSDRVAFVEVYTGAGCPPCVAADLAFDATLERYSRGDVALVMFHEHIPRPDPLTNTDTVARWKWLKGRGVPTYVIDGQEGGGGGPRAYAAELELKNREVIEKRLEVPAAARLGLEAVRVGEAVRVKARVSDLKKESPDLKLHVALVEKLIRYSGENGIRFHPMVVRKHVTVDWKVGADPEWAHEFDLALVAREVKQHLDDFEKHDERHNKDGKFRFMDRPEKIAFGNLAVVAWVQDDQTREVYQSMHAEVVGQ